MPHLIPARSASTLIILGLTLTFATGCLEDEWEKLTSSGGGGGGKGKNEETALIADAAASESDPDDHVSGDPPKPVVHLDPRRAQTRGEAKYKCWDNCWWVVWCGHNICDGSWTWTFPSSGSYEITWENVKEKCAGSPSYEVRINGETVTSSRVPQHGSCDGCSGGGRWVDRSLGTFDIEEGDDVTLWVENDFACGIDGPGAYAAHESLRADLR